MGYWKGPLSAADAACRIGNGIQARIRNIVAADRANAVGPCIDPGQGRLDLRHFVERDVSEALEDLLAFDLDRAFLEIRITGLVRPSRAPP